jgi:Putative ATPase subunit of terminase (gpP-like)
MKEIQTTQSQTKPPADREAVRVLAIELGAREAARRLGLNPNTVLSWSKRYNWELPNRRGGATKASANAITLQSKPGDVLIATHRELEGRTKTGLAQATVRAAEAAAKAAEPIPVSNTAQLRDLAASAARIFGWNTDGPQVQLNQQVVITQEQLEQIRQLREPVVYEAPWLEEPPQQFPASSGSVGYEVKVTPP